MCYCPAFIVSAGQTEGYGGNTRVCVIADVVAGQLALQSDFCGHRRILRASDRDHDIGSGFFNQHCYRFVGSQFDSVCHCQAAGLIKQSTGDVQAIMVMPDGTLQAASDPRRGGKAVGW